MSVSTSSPRRLRGTSGWKGLPGVEHLNVASKLLLLGVILLVPFIVSLGNQIRINWDRSVVFAQREQLGIKLICLPAAEGQLRPGFAKLITDMEESRFTAQGYCSGDKDSLDNVKAANGYLALPPGVTAPPAEAGAPPQVDDVKAMDAALPDLEALGLAEKWGEVKKSIVDIVTNNVNYSADECAKKYDACMDQVLELYSLMADKSGLSLDPDVDTHYANDILMLRIPQLEQAVGQSCALLARRAAEKKKLSVEDKAELAKFAALITWQNDEMGKSFDKLIQARVAEGDPNDMKTGVGKFLSDPHKQLAAYVNYLDHVNLGTAKVDDWNSQVAEVIGSGGALTETFLPYISRTDPKSKIEGLLDIRIQHNRAQVVMSVIIAIVAVLLAALIGFYLVSDINRPLRATLLVANSIAKGDINFTIPEVNRRDEFGALNRSLRAMVANLQEILSSIGMTVTTLTAATSEIMTTTSQLAVSSTQMATAVNEATTTVEEVKQTAQVSSQRAQQVAQSAQQAAQVSQAGRQATDETLEEMNRIKEQMLSIAESIVRLSEQTQAISEIIASVNDLAEQSNLLAVNASIEAAKAGEQGRGFAVVAQEVRHLAEQSKQSTAQVRNILSDIQRATGGAVMVAEQGTKAVELGVRQSKEAGDSIKTLATRVVEAAQAAVQISASTHQQLVGMDQVVTAMMGIKDGSVQTAASMRNVQTSAQRLYEMTQSLKKLTERYSSN